MNLLRAIRSDAITRRLVSVIGAGYILLVHHTTRWTVVGAEHQARVTSGEGRWLVGIWHGRILALPPMKTRRFACYALISNNKDGEIIAATTRLFGIEAVRGSSRDKVKNRDKGGREAFERAAVILKERRDVVFAITPDGPRGPRQRCQHGLATLSVATQTPVVPLTFSVRRGINLKSWDRTLLPWPINRGVKIFGDPIVPPAETGAEAIEVHRLLIEAALNDLTRRADEMCGRTPIEPAEPLM